MTYNECKAIADLDLDPIKVKLMHHESGEGWTLEQANAVEAEYRRFLYLMMTFPHEAAAPLMDVDTFWHYHILDTMKYARDCDAVFGYFLHHFPYVGLRGEDDLAAHEQMGDRMRELYEATFGDKYRAQPLSHEVQATAFSSAPAVAFSSAPAKPAQQTLATAFSSAPAIAFSSAPAKPAQEKLATAFSLAPAIAFSSAPAKPAQEKLATAFSSAPAIAVSSAPAKPARNQDTAFSSAPAIDMSSALQQVTRIGKRPGAVGMEKLGPAMAEFFSIRPRLESSAIA
jgi:hypothetical protein